MNVVLEDGETTPKIFGGETDDDRRSLESVVALKVGSSGEYELCSGVLVAPNVVLTARHCVANSLTTSVACDENGHSTNGQHVAGNQPPSAVNVFTGASPSFAGAPVATGKAIISPKGDHLCDSDIAIVVLDHKIADVEPVAVRLEVGVAPGETVRSVGYGKNDSRLPLGTRLRKEGVAVLAMGSSVSESKTALGMHEFEVGRGTCQGDSGGPAISEDTNAVVGVVSRGGDCEEDFGHVYTTTAGWKSLFDEAFAIAGGAPIVESGRPAGPELGPNPKSKTVRSPLSDQPAQSQACSMGPSGQNQGHTALGLLGALAAIGAVRSRMRVRSRVPATATHDET